MAQNELRINLDDLSFTLWHNDKGKHLVYFFEFNDCERTSASLVTKRYDYVDNEYECVGSVSETITLEAHKETQRGAVLCWALKGIWGLPSEYGRKETQSKS